MITNSKLRNSLFASIIALFALSIVLAIVHPAKPVRAMQPGLNMPVVGLELAWSTREIWDIIGDPTQSAGQKSREAFFLGTWMDFGYITVYSLAYLFLNLLLIHRHGVSRLWTVSTIVLVVTTALADVIENQAIFGILAAGSESLAEQYLPQLIVFTRIKWFALGLSGLPASILLRREGRRGPSFILTAAFAFGALGVLKQYSIEIMTLFTAFFWAFLLVKLMPLKNRWFSENAR